MQMSGNATVDKLYGVEITGNVIPQSWFQTFVNDKGKPATNAIMILGEILYWYNFDVDPMEMLLQSREGKVPK